MAKSDTKKSMPESGRTRARRNAMMVLYKVDLLPSGQVQDSLDAFESEHGFPLPSYAHELVLGVAGDIERIDHELDSRLTGWSLARLGAALARAGFIPID